MSIHKSWPVLALSAALLGATCEPSNQPPNAPKVYINTYDATSITVVFGNNCIDPDNTGWCHQHVIVTGGGQTTYTARATGGVATITGRLPGQRYDIYPYHVDEGGQRTNGTPVLDWQTAGNAGPRVTGLAPTEALPGELVNVYGVWFDPGTTVRLVDPRNGASYPASTQSFTRNRISVRLPTPGNLGIGRTAFFLVTDTNRKVHERADRIYLSSSSEYLPPPGEKISLAFIRWQPSAVCSGLLCGGCSTNDGWYPPVRDALRSLHGMPAGDDWWPDTWLDPFWALLQLLANDTGREWQAMCSEAWAASPRIGGVASVYPQVTEVSGNNYWLNTQFNDDDLYRLAERKRVGTMSEGGGYVPFCQEVTDRQQPADCSKWKANSNTHVNVHLVGALMNGSNEIDPALLRGVTNLPTADSPNTDGMIILTDSPYRYARKKTQPILVNGVPSADECVSHYYSPGDPVGLTYWWGPQAGYGHGHSPNILSHELHHALTGYGHSPTLPDTCWTPAVGEPTDSCGRGFNLALTADLSASEGCQRAASGLDGNDYTH